MEDRRVIKALGSWEEMRVRFRWDVPEKLNIAALCCDSWCDVDPGKVALIHVSSADHSVKNVTYGDLRKASNAFANALVSDGINQGDRVAALLPQSAEVIITHLAVYKTGGIILPLFYLFGAEALEYRLKNSGARAVVTDLANLSKIEEISERLLDLKAIYCVDGDSGAAKDFWAQISKASDDFRTLDTASEDPALIAYTSGTTGPPKGVLHAHRFLIGHLPSIELHHESFPQKGDIGWTPADWAWLGGLMNMALPCLYYGVPLVVHRMVKFDPEFAYDLIGRHGVKNMFLPPTALRLMKQAEAPKSLSIRSVGSGGEALGESLLGWGRENLGVNINEFYGQTECNLMLGNSSGLMDIKPGSTGKATPGFDVAIIDSNGNEMPPGESGEIAVRRGAKSMFLEYWRQPEKTRDKFIGDWLRTGDVGMMDEDGYFSFSSRDDDVITSSGYRIGPTEIEDCLAGHPDVAMAAVVGVPDPVRTEVVKGFVVLREGAKWDGLESDLIQRVRDRLSPHLAPKSIDRIEKMPLTSTGKVMRRELRVKD